MSDFEKQLNKVASGIKLSAAEKRELKARVVSFMEYHPRREKVAVEKAAAYIESQPYSIISIHNRMLQAAFGVFAILVFIVVPTVAERAVPGDVLYPIKFRVNEELRSSLTFSATEKIEWETERLERRISEVRLLAQEGKLTEETQAQAVEAVKAHAQAAQGEIDKLRESDADAASMAEVEFESALEVQSVVLEAGKKNSTSSAEAADNISVVVREAQANAEAAKSSTTPSYEKITARLELQTTRAYEYITALDEYVSEAERAEINRRLEDIERKILAGNAVYGEEGRVGEQLLSALAGVQKLISFMTDIDVRASVELETLVPIELTIEEKVIKIEEHKIAAQTVMALYKTVAESGEVEAGLLEKAEVGVALIEEHLAAIAEANKAGDVEAQFGLGVEMKLIAEELETFLRTKAPETPIELPLPVEDETGSTTDEVVASTTDDGTEQSNLGTTTSSTSVPVVSESQTTTN